MSVSSPNCPTPTLASGVRVLSHFEQLVQLFSRWEGGFEQFSCGRFEGQVLSGRGRLAYAHRVTLNQSIHVRGREGRSLVAISLVLPESAECFWQRRKVDAGQLVIRHGDVEADHVTSRAAVNMTLTVSEGGLRTAARALTRTDPRSFGWAAVRPSPTAFERLDVAVRRFLTTASSPDAGAHFRTASEQACVRAAVESLFPAATRRVELPLAARAALVSRAEEYMRARLRVPVGEIDLCVEFGMSGRTLRRAFRESYGWGPMAHYQALRLNAARADLKSTGTVGTSVEAIGRTYGFHHPGKFAGYYHRQFGEHPSAAKGRNGRSSQWGEGR